MPRHLRPLLTLALACMALASAFSRSDAHQPASVPIADLTIRIAAHPDSLPLHLMRGELRRITGDFRGALEDYAEVERLDPREPRLVVCRAALALDTGDPAAAERLLDPMLAAHPDDPDALKLRARARVALGERRAAIADLSAAIGLLERPSPDLYLERARLEIAEGDQAGAGAGLEEARSRIGPAPSLELFAIDLDLAGGRPSDARARFEALASHYADRSALAGLDARIGAAERLPGAGTLGSEAAAIGPAGRHVGPVPVSAPRADGTAPNSVTALNLVLPRKATWKYSTGADLGTTWRQAAYSDSAWTSGAGILGYGEPYVATTVPYGPDPANRYPTAYFRTTFQMPLPVPPIVSLTMTARYDDGIVVYLNGSEVARRGISSNPAYAALATSHEGGAYEDIDLSGAKALLAPGTNLLAVEVHQNSIGSTDLVWDADLGYSNLPHLTRGPYLQMGTDSAVTVRWRTSSATNSRVRFGASPVSLTNEVADTAVTTEHEVRITGLAPATSYYYAVGSTIDVIAGGDSSYTFRTAPHAGVSAPVRAWVVGDSGTPGAVAYAVRDAYVDWAGTHRADLWLMLGDNAYSSGTDSEYQSAVFDQYPSILRRCVLWPTRGNHEVLHTGPNNDYYDLFTMPATGQCGGVPSGTEAYYSFNWSNIHFICLDSEGSDKTPAGAMLSWLVNDLGANVRPWVVAFWHHPPYSKGSHDSDGEGALVAMRENALPILEAGGVDLVLCGHSHSYERSFLLNGHYGISTTLTPAMVVDGGDGRPDGNGPYRKPTGARPITAGAVYAVAGSSSHTSPGPLNHPVMVASLEVAGSMVIDVAGLQLSARFLNDAGTVLDSFTILKESWTGVEPGRGTGLSLAAPLPNPFAGGMSMSYVLDRAGQARVTIYDLAGRRIAVIDEGWRAAGVHEARWEGRDREGRMVPNGVYLAILEAHGERATRKIAHVR